MHCFVVFPLFFSQVFDECRIYDHLSIIWLEGQSRSLRTSSHHIPQYRNLYILFTVPFSKSMYLDRRLTWRKHISTKRKQLDLKLQNLYRIIGHKSQLSLENTLLVHKVILKPVWTYGIQIWGTASNSNLEILERSQSKALRKITDVPRYVPNTQIIKRDLQIPTVKQEARRCSANCRKRHDTDPTNLANTLFKEQFGTRRLKRLCG
jgi:hypothetical protein